MRKNFKSNLILVVVLVLESKGLWCSLGQSVDKTKNLIGSRESTGPGGYQIFESGQYKDQTVDYCFHHAMSTWQQWSHNLFSNPKKTVHCQFALRTTPFWKSLWTQSQISKWIYWPIILSRLLIFCAIINNNLLRKQKELMFNECLYIW